MTVDLVLLGLVLLFGLVGAVQGVAKQIAHLVALVVAVLFSRPVGTYLGPTFAQGLNAPQVVGTVAATFVAFIVLIVSVRLVVTALLKKILAGKKPEDRGLDRGLGFAFAAFKVLAIAYVVFSALTFAEQQITVAGKKLGFTPKDSLAFGFAHTYNLFTWVHFAPVRDFVEVARALGNPQSPKEVRQDPSVKALREDPRFRKAVASKDVQAALERGDFTALLKSDLVLALVQDKALAAQLDAAAKRLQGP